jgi:hypothetical protein
MKELRLKPAKKATGSNILRIAAYNYQTYPATGERSFEKSLWPVILPRFPGVGSDCSLTLASDTTTAVVSV